MASTGLNEVQVSTTGAYQCWVYGNYMSNTAVATDFKEAYKSAEYVAAAWPAMWVGLKALEMQSWGVCKIRTTFTTTNNQIIIPMTQNGKKDVNDGLLPTTISTNLGNANQLVFGSD